MNKQRILAAIQKFESLMPSAGGFVGTFVAEVKEALLETVEEDLGQGIRRLMGYVENGTDTAVRIVQDDATRTYILTVGKKRYQDASYTGVLRKALAEVPEEN